MPLSLRLLLFVAGSSPNSQMARANLTRLLDGHSGDVELEVIDVFEHPERQWEAGILATPTLIKVAPPPQRTIIGNLSDRNTVLEALGLGGSHDRA